MWASWVRRADADGGAQVVVTGGGEVSKCEVTTGGRVVAEEPHVHVLREPDCEPREHQPHLGSQVDPT